MDQPRPPARKPNPAAGGAPIAITTLIGAIWGISRGEPTIGVLVGLGVGIAIAVAIWLISARRD